MKRNCIHAYKINTNENEKMKNDERTNICWTIFTAAENNKTIDNE